MKNTTANTATTTNKGGRVMFNNVLTAAVINTATKMGAYVPKGLKVQMVNGEIISNGFALIMNEALKGKFSKSKAILYKMDLEAAIKSTHVKETVVDVIGTLEAENVIANMPVEPSIEEAAVITEKVKTEVAETSMAINAFEKARINKEKRKAIKAQQRVIKANFKRAQVLKAREMKAQKAVKSLGFKGMNKTGFVGLARKRALSKDQKITINTLKAKKDGGFELGITTMEENEAIRLGFLKGEEYVARFGRTFDTFDNFSKEIVVADFNADTSACTGMTEFFVWWSKSRTVFAKCVGGVYYDLISGKALKARVNPPKRYELIGGSPASLRKDQTLAFDVTNGYENVDRILDAVTDGGYSKNKGKKATAAQMSKYVTRFFAWTAPNKVVGVVNNNAIYFGKWSKNKLDGMAFVSSKFYAKALSKVLRVKLTEETVEGLSVQCRPYSAKTLGVVVDMETQFGLISAEAKKIVYIDTVTPAIDKELDLAFNGEGQYANCMVVFGKEGCDIEFVSDLNGYKTEVNWGKPSNFRVLDITKIEENSIIKGANTSVQMWESPLDNDAAATIEFLKTLRNEEIVEIFNELYVDRSIKVPSLVELAKNVHVQGIVKQIAPSYALDKDFSMYKKIQEELFVRINKADGKFKYAIDGCYNRIIADISCLAVKSGILQYGEAYIANGEAYFTNAKNADRFIKESAAVRECYGKRIVSMFKYPKMGTKEYYKAALITLERIESRVNRLVMLNDITQEQGDTIIAFYTALKAGTIVVPAIDLLKQQCAGLDFDWDGASIIFDPRFNALLPNSISITNIKTSEKAVENKTAAPTKGLVSLVKSANLNPNSGISICAETLKEAFLANATADNGGWSIGSITNTNTTQIAVLNLAKMTRKKKYFLLMADMLKSWFGHDGGEDTYTGLAKRTVDLASMDNLFPFGNVEEAGCGISCTVTDVSPLSVSKCIASIENANWSDPKTLIAIFEDLNEMFRYYQEITIDSAKTGESVTISIAPGRKYHACMLNKNELVWNWERSIEASADSEQGALNIKVNDEAPTESKTPIQDMFFQIRKEFAEELEEMSVMLLKEKDVKMALADVVELGKLHNNAKFLGTLGNTSSSPVAAMVKINEIFGDLTANYMEAKAIAGKDKEALDIATQTYSKGLKGLRTVGRSVMERLGLTMEEAGAFAKFIASHNFRLSKVGTQERYTAIVHPTGGSTFASTIFSEEYLAYITKNFAEIDFCGEKLSYNEFYQDGDIVTLVNGISEYAATTADITGDFVVREFDGKFYATKLIKEVLTVKQNDSVLVRISDAAEAELAKIRANLVDAGDVTLLAQSVRNIDGTYEHTYGVFNKAVKLAGVDAQGAIAKAINGKKGNVDTVFSGVTEYNGVRKPYVLALVATK